MKLSSVQQLFNSFDPAPFREKGLDGEAESYIIDTVKDFPSNTPFKIVIYLAEDLLRTREAQQIPEAIKGHFEYLAASQNRKFRERYNFGKYALVVGLSFLAIATIASLAIDNYSSSYPVAHIVANVLVVTGWVAMWEPVTVFLFQLWPIVKQRKVYEHISRMEVDVRPYPKSSPHALELPSIVPQCNP
jgi:hypothetical protein